MTRNPTCRVHFPGDFGLLLNKSLAQTFRRSTGNLGLSKQLFLLLWRLEHIELGLENLVMYLRVFQRGPSIVRFINRIHYGLPFWYDSIG
jgi:hypothetical protein